MTTRIIAVIITLALFAGCAATKKPAGRMEDVTESRATVTAVDLQRRLLTLKDSGGGKVVVEAGPEVRNFDQIKVGDEVVTSYTQAVAWQVKRAGEGAPGRQHAGRRQTRPAGREARWQHRQFGDGDGHDHCDRHGERHSDDHRAGWPVAHDQGA